MTAGQSQRPDYRNWVPLSLEWGLAALCCVLVVALVLVATPLPGSVGRTILLVILVVALLAALKFTQWSVMAHRAFSYDGKRHLSRDIVEGVAGYVQVPAGGVCLDVGCGSGALTIACAKRNPQARVVGCDLWGKGYSFSQDLCERNAQTEGVSNVEFVPGDATKLPFADETFDAVTSNYVYHNITGRNKQDLLLETLRVLKKGGTFALSDLMSKARYGDMEAFVQRLRDMGYERVELIDATDGLLMTKAESRRYMLQGSAILVGRK